MVPPTHRKFLTLCLQNL